MIKESTTFIIGAGGSLPYGFPLGSGLREYIVLKFVEQYSSLVKEHLNNVGGAELRFIEQGKNELQEFSDQFFKSDTSIDLFLTRNNEFENIGKKAIALKLLYDEMHSHFSEYMKLQPREKDEKYIPNQNWYSYLFNEMTEEIRSFDEIDMLLENKVKFITFNYDRSLEHFFYTRLVANFAKKSKEKQSQIAKLVQKFGFYHVYGRIGYLPWQITDEENQIDYGKYSYPNIEKAANQIRIMHTNERPSSEQEIIQKTIFNSKRVMFLGFAFAKENLDALGINNFINKDLIVGTGIGYTAQEIKKVQSYFGNNPHIGRIQINRNFDCLKILRTYK